MNDKMDFYEDDLEQDEPNVFFMILCCLICKVCSIVF